MRVSPAQGNRDGLVQPMLGTAEVYSLCPPGAQGSRDSKQVAPEPATQVSVMVSVATTASPVGYRLRILSSAPGSYH